MYKDYYVGWFLWLNFGALDVRGSETEVKLLFLALRFTSFSAAVGEDKIQILKHWKH